MVIINNFFDKKRQIITKYLRDIELILKQLKKNKIKNLSLTEIRNIQKY